MSVDPRIYAFTHVEDTSQHAKLSNDPILAGSTALHIAQWAVTCKRDTTPSPTDASSDRTTPPLGLHTARTAIIASSERGTTGTASGASPARACLALSSAGSVRTAHCCAFVTTCVRALASHRTASLLERRPCCRAPAPPVCCCGCAVGAPRPRLLAIATSCCCGAGCAHCGGAV